MRGFVNLNLQVGEDGKGRSDGGTKGRSLSRRRFGGTEVMWKGRVGKEEVMGEPASARVQFEAKWKETLVCTMDGKRFSIELTMGVLKVYLPTQSRWEAVAPDWARSQWERVREDLAVWCLRERIPLVVDESAWVEFE